MTSDVLEVGVMHAADFFVSPRFIHKRLNVIAMTQSSLIVLELEHLDELCVLSRSRGRSEDKISSLLVMSLTAWYK